jgi:hypothetical protein
MADRFQLQAELESFLPNVYFQPPANITMKYPCIVYRKTGKNRHFAGDVLYLSQQGYTIQVIDRDPDSDVADRIEKHFQHCGNPQYHTVDNLHHTTLSLYY